MIASRLSADHKQIIGQNDPVQNSEYYKRLSNVMYNDPMDLNSLIIVEKISRLGTFTAAARDLRLPNSNLSLKVKQLEEDLGQPLFTRSTRQVVITEFGRQVLEEARSLIEAKARIEALAERANLEPTGTLRLTAPYDVGLYLLRSVIPEFSRMHAGLNIELELSNSYVDLIARGFDMAIRASTRGLSDSSHIALKLGSTALRLYGRSASAYGAIGTISQLRKVPVLSMAADIKLKNGKKQELVEAKSSLVVKDMVGIKHAVLGQAGIGILPEFICTEEVENKVLTNILPDWTAGRGVFYALYPPNAFLTPKNELFIEFLRQKFRLE